MMKAIIKYIGTILVFCLSFIGFAFIFKSLSWVYKLTHYTTPLYDTIGYIIYAVLSFIGAVHYSFVFYHKMGAKK